MNERQPDLSVFRQGIGTVRLNCEICGGCRLPANRVLLHRVFEPAAGWEAIYTCPVCHEGHVVPLLPENAVKAEAAGATSPSLAGKGPPISYGEAEEFERLLADDYTVSVALLALERYITGCAPS